MANRPVATTSQSVQRAVECVANGPGDIGVAPALPLAGDASRDAVQPVFNEARCRPIAMSIREAARLSGLSRSYLYVAISAKQLKTVRKGRRRLIMFDDLRAYLALSRQ